MVYGVSRLQGLGQSGGEAADVVPVESNVFSLRDHGARGESGGTAGGVNHTLCATVREKSTANCQTTSPLALGVSRKKVICRHAVDCDTLCAYVQGPGPLVLIWVSCRIGR